MVGKISLLICQIGLCGTILAACQAGPDTITSENISINPTQVLVSNLATETLTASLSPTPPISATHPYTQASLTFLTHNVTPEIYSTQDPLTIRYTEYEENAVHPSMQRWFEIQLPDGETKEIEYPHKGLLTDALRIRLGIEDDDRWGIWFRELRFSPSGEKVIYKKRHPIPPDPDCMMCPTSVEYLWQANGDGTNAQQLGKLDYTLIEYALWSDDENKLILVAKDDASGVHINYLIDLSQNIMIPLDIRSKDAKLDAFYPGPNISPDECCIAGSLYPTAGTDDLEFKFLDMIQNISRKYYLATNWVYPLWSDDGQYIYTLGRDWTLYRIQVSDGSVTILARIDGSHISYPYNSGYFHWRIFPEQQFYVIGTGDGLILVKWSEASGLNPTFKLTPVPNVAP